MRTTILSLALLIGLVPIGATPPAEPICGSPSSFELVQSIRRQMLMEQKMRRGTLSAFQTELPPRLAIGRDEPLGLPQLILSGTIGRTYELEGISSLDSESWRSILTVHLAQNDLEWNGVDTREAPFQFFRLRSGEPDGIGDSASNFRLLDQQGISRDLYYHQHQRQSSF